MSEKNVDVARLAQWARNLVDSDGEWPSAAYEEAPQAKRAAAMQDAIRMLADCVLELQREASALRSTSAPAPTEAP